MWDRVSACDQAVMIAGKAYYRVVVAPQRSWWPRIYITRGCLWLTSEARLALTRAEDEARRLRHRYIGTEHILLGLLHDGEGSATSTLSSLGVSAESIRREVEQIIGYGLDPVPDDELLPLTPRAAASLQLSRPEALRLADQQLGTEHVLLGLIAEGEAWPRRCSYGRAPIRVASAHCSTGGCQVSAIRPTITRARSTTARTSPG